MNWGHFNTPAIKIKKKKPQYLCLVLGPNFHITHQQLFTIASNPSTSFGDHTKLFNLIWFVSLIV